VGLSTLTRAVSQFLWHYNRHTNGIRYHYHYHIICVKLYRHVHTQGTENSNRLVFLPILSYLMLVPASVRPMSPSTRVQSPWLGRMTCRHHYGDHKNGPYLPVSVHSCCLTTRLPQITIVELIIAFCSESAKDGRPHCVNSSCTRNLTRVFLFVDEVNTTPVLVFERIKPHCTVLHLQLPTSICC
jgi:hypothetical protein